MNEFFQHLKKEALNIKLSLDEKQSLRVALYDAMKRPPAVMPVVKVVRAARSTYVWFSPRFIMPLATFLVIVLGTGTAYAAQGALPGDPLYPIKLHVNEEVEMALATTPAQKATTEQHIAERRVAEAQTLEAQGRLDATTTQELEDSFNEHASRALAFRGEKLVATTSVMSVSVQQQGESEHKGPRTGAFMVAPTTPEATPESTLSEAQATDSSLQNSEDDISASLQTQRNILDDIKLRVDKNEHGGDNNNNRGDKNSDQGN